MKYDESLFVETSRAPDLGVFSVYPFFRGDERSFDGRSKNLHLNRNGDEGGGGVASAAFIW